MLGHATPDIPAKNPENAVKKCLPNNILFSRATKGKKGLSSKGPMQRKRRDQADWDKDDNVDDNENVDDDETDDNNYEFDDDCDDDNIVPKLNSTTIEKMGDLTPEFFANMLGCWDSITNSNNSCIENVDEDDEANEEELHNVSFNDLWLEKSEERCEKTDSTYEPDVEEDYEKINLVIPVQEKEQTFLVFQHCPCSRGFHLLGEWAFATVNHLYWSVLTCNGDPNDLQEHFCSIIYASCCKPPFQFRWK
ncbi:uncharacterized protein LOC130644952 isoform X2 [Hydractinia symbiolongicarpus]|uniref:uncharacterized protein LOC130644952 isoform X2 n=1 Tax=Hydractinia symbiolongicarpus TaxID=13093 RepID=UPI00254CBF63|nr:uncharacterized protein LOC130644952 isoform X2 [Hydractinia symbiolongicarpus]